MPADRNKTELTLRVTEAAAAWLAGIGAKAIETELFVDEGWQADLAALWSPTRTEAQRTKLLRPRPRCPAMPPYERFHEARDAWEKTYTALPRVITIAHEVKTARSDFRRDTKWDRPPPADMRVLSIGPDVAREDELPEGWWVLRHHATGRLRSVTPAGVTPVDLQQRFWIAVAIAERRHNRTANAFLRDLQKTHRDEASARQTATRFRDAIRIVLAIARGERESAEDCLEYYAHRDRIPESLQAELASIYGIARGREGE